MKKDRARREYQQRGAIGRRAILGFKHTKDYVYTYATPIVAFHPSEWECKSTHQPQGLDQIRQIHSQPESFEIEASLDDDGGGSGEVG